MPPIQTAAHPFEYAKMNDKQTYTFETYTLLLETRRRENAEPLLVATAVMPDNFVLTGRFPLRPVDRENELNVIRFLEKTFDLKPYFKTHTFEGQLGEFDQLRIQHRKQQYDTLMDALLDRTSELK
ncbi:hypothetical protein [Eikenella sp. Marseille-P7795]|uniref:hypothetical protein n=1 Tax=Eikenella sp. Marseille-P7795 TaxID=2866577 RepID=UPI001CE44532|nr:hypothetical protein [Eikenella sp. Marseille-P7795]